MFHFGCVLSKEVQTHVHHRRRSGDSSSATARFCYFSIKIAVFTPLAYHISQVFEEFRKYQTAKIRKFFERIIQYCPAPSAPTYLQIKSKTYVNAGTMGLIFPSDLAKGKLNFILNPLPSQLRHCNESAWN